jgi:hypothetical protein
MRIEIQRSGGRFRVVTVERESASIMGDYDSYQAARNEAMHIRGNTGWVVISRVEDDVRSVSVRRGGKSTLNSPHV